jgi:hypothetical protein
MTAPWIPDVDAAANVPSTRTLGTGAQQAAPGTVISRLPALSFYGASSGGVVGTQPLLNFYTNPDGTGDVLKWQIGLDSSNGVNDDLVLAARNNGGSVTDFLVRPKECEQS